MAVTVSGTSITFNDNTVQTTAGGAGPISLFTGSGSVGDMALLVCTQNAAFSSGATVSGSFLFRITSYGTAVSGFGPGVAFNFNGDARNRTTAFSENNTSYSPQTGTWRLLNATRTNYISTTYGQATFLTIALAIRIS